MNLIINSPKSAIAFNILSYKIHWYGIILAVAIAFGLVISFILIKKKFGYEKADEFIDFSPTLIIFSIIGARLFYVAGMSSYYIDNPKEILMINHGGISIYGAIITGIIVLLLYFKKKKYNTLQYLDILSVAMPISQAVGRWGNYFNQEAYGTPVNSFLKLYIDPIHRYENYKDFEYFHPTFLYESILNTILFFALLFILHKYKNIKDGTIFCLYLIFYGIIRTITEIYRIDSIMFVGKLSIAQLISLIIIAIASIRLILLYKNKASKI